MPTLHKTVKHRFNKTKEYFSMVTSYFKAFTVISQKLLTNVFTTFKLTGFLVSIIRREGGLSLEDD